MKTLKQLQHENSLIRKTAYTKAAIAAKYFTYGFILCV